MPDRAGQDYPVPTGRILHLGEEGNVHAILSTKGTEREEKFFNYRGHSAAESQPMENVKLRNLPLLSASVRLCGYQFFVWCLGKED
uniref:Uncharacterized protein n=2 Tax=Candidatus Kentrum sp. FM TaxID=2126340 RepID=A0A450WQI0_9GAMM|nr:MAG: hypothetical protein BECKFM1743C_GA0114222_106021 [Candidatus Kentron sp. FM]VFK19316.1 MAG: hypothetical protein BECKFM1743B_GA0114221_106111 [Candidatus Kentron sp. FM]